MEHCRNDLSVEVVILALQKAVEKNAQYSYAKGIMKSWANKGIKTLEAAEVESLGNIRQKQNQWRQQSKKEIVPPWAESSVPVTETPLDPDQESVIQDRIARLKTSQKKEG